MQRGSSSACFFLKRGSSSAYRGEFFSVDNFVDLLKYFMSCVYEIRGELFSAEVNRIYFLKKDIRIYLINI